MLHFLLEIQLVNNLILAFCDCGLARHPHPRTDNNASVSAQPTVGAIVYRSTKWFGIRATRYLCIADWKCGMVTDKNKFTRIEKERRLPVKN